MTTARTDLLVIGAGVAGMAAALFASSRGIDVSLAGSVGGIDFTTGFIDVMGVHPVKDAKRRNSPWQAWRELVAEQPNHPYAKLTEQQSRDAIDEFTRFFETAGLPFKGNEDFNVRMLTSMGTTKRTYRLPASMWAGVDALSQKAPCLVVDFQGLKGFSSAQILEMNKRSWPELANLRIDFPNQTEELYPEHMAWAMQNPNTREAVANSIRPHLGQAKYVALPAILGHDTTSAVIKHLEELLGVRVFEIPTLPPSLSGIRMRAAFDRELPARGVRLYSQKMILGTEPCGDGYMCSIGREHTETSIRAKAIILATGRFFGKGLTADRTGIAEPIFNIPIKQPAARQDWHQQEFYAPEGHRINWAGIETDEQLRPLDSQNNVFSPRIFAAGAILAHQDWTRQKCGSGLAITTAYKAVQSALQLLGKTEDN